nr:hypothetical protein [Mucilaginibacter sp. E4BP6]
MAQIKIVANFWLKPEFIVAYPLAEANGND